MIGGHPAFQVPEGKTIYDYTLVFNKEGKEAGNHQEELHYLAPNDQGYQVEEKTGSLKLKDGQVPVTKGFFDQILTYMFDGAQISSVGLLVDETPYVTIDCGDFPYLGVSNHRGNPSICMPGAMVRPVRSRRIQGRIKRPAGHPEAGSLGNLGEELQHPDRIEPRS